jgi:hypothetical protein
MRGRPESRLRPGRIRLRRFCRHRAGLRRIIHPVRGRRRHSVGPGGRLLGRRGRAALGGNVAVRRVGGRRQHAIAQGCGRSTRTISPPRCGARGFDDGEERALQGRPRRRGSDGGRNAVFSCPWRGCHDVKARRLGGTGIAAPLHAQGHGCQKKCRSRRQLPIKSNDHGRCLRKCTCCTHKEVLVGIA